VRVRIAAVAIGIFGTVQVMLERTIIGFDQVIVDLFEPAFRVVAFSDHRMISRLCSTTLPLGRTSTGTVPLGEAASISTGFAESLTSRMMHVVRSIAERAVRGSHRDSGGTSRVGGGAR
jgi:hypothetical protein